MDFLSAESLLKGHSEALLRPELDIEPGSIAIINNGHMPLRSLRHHYARGGRVLPQGLHHITVVQLAPLPQPMQPNERVAVLLEGMRNRHLLIHLHLMQLALHCNKPLLLITTNSPHLLTYHNYPS